MRLFVEVFFFWKQTNKIDVQCAFSVILVCSLKYRAKQTCSKGCTICMGAIYYWTDLGNVYYQLFVGTTLVVADE